ncbi:MAG: response regulator transcription factor [Pedobacter sp.]|nr:MAG: response regulator transcription factor [Pedobacter sp.]
MSSTLSECTLLVVEPDIYILELLEMVFVEEGTKVYGFRNLSAVDLDNAFETQFDLAIIATRGYNDEVVEFLKKLRLKFSLPVLAFSCDVDIEAKADCLGFDDYIVKPFDIDTLLRQLSAAVESFRAKNRNN